MTQRPRLWSLFRGKENPIQYTLGLLRRLPGSIRRPMGAGFSADRVVIGVGCVGSIMFARGWEIALIQRRESYGLGDVIDEATDVFISPRCKVESFFWMKDSTGNVGVNSRRGCRHRCRLGRFFSRTIHGIGMGVNNSSQQAQAMAEALKR